MREKQDGRVLGVMLWDQGVKFYRAIRNYRGAGNGWLEGGKLSFCWGISLSLFFSLSLSFLFLHLSLSLPSIFFLLPSASDVEGCWFPTGQNPSGGPAISHPRSWSSKAYALAENKFVLCRRDMVLSGQRHMPTFEVLFFCFLHFCFVLFFKTCQDLPDLGS